MSRYDHLPIYKASYDLFMKSSYLINNFPKPIKHAIGERILTELVDIIAAVVRANSTPVGPERIRIIDNILSRIVTLQVYFRLCKDTQALSIAAFSEIAESTEGISRQASGWRTSTHNKIAGGQSC
jgi:hypothetical protein